MWRRGLVLHNVRSITHRPVTALDHLQPITIIHGEMKPENTKVVHQQPIRVKLVDFGGAQVSSQASPKTGLHP